MEIQRTPHGTRISLTVERPGLVIGRKGTTIKKLTKQVEEEFHFDNPQIEVRDSENPNVNAQIMAQKLASALERGWHFRRAGHSTVRRIMDGGARGCMIVISGKLTGQRHRTEKFSNGHIKYCGDTALKWMDKGFAVAKNKLGVIGVKVMIMKEDARLPDEVLVKDPDPDEEDGRLVLRPERMEGVDDDKGEGDEKEKKGEDIVEIIMEEIEEKKVKTKEAGGKSKKKTKIAKKTEGKKKATGGKKVVENIEDKDTAEEKPVGKKVKKEKKKGETKIEGGKE